MKKLILLIILLISLQLSAAEEQIAVMEILDDAKILKPKQVEDATRFFYTRLSGKLNIIDWTLQAKILDNMVTEGRVKSRKKCVDDKCQIELGQELSANYIYRSRITKMGKICTFAAEMINLKTKMTEIGRGAYFDFNCNYDELSGAISRVVNKLTGEEPGIEKEIESESKPVATDDKACEFAKNKDDIDVWKEYLKDSPKGSCSLEAKTRIKELKKKEDEEKAERIAEEKAAKLRKIAEEKEAKLREIAERKEETKRKREESEAEKRAASAEKASSVGMATIPAGYFWMGCVEGDSKCSADEKPRHKVYVSAFKMDKKEVTAGEFKQCVNAGNCSSSGLNMPYWSGKEQPDWAWTCTYNTGKDSHPINCVDWSQAKAYCEWKGKRLPTEAEWEKAARGGTESIYYWGNNGDNACSYGNVADKSAKEKWSDWTIAECRDGYQTTAPVGSFKPNSYGLYDMAGNVWEWNSDWYDENYYQSSPEKNPEGAGSGSYRVLRGGSWVYNSESVRASNRRWYGPDSRNYNIGFRCVSE